MVSAAAVANRHRGARFYAFQQYIVTRLGQQGELRKQIAAGFDAMSRARSESPSWLALFAFGPQRAGVSAGC
eukprot:5806107-Lingulodinium_polyedra.AAC.1